MSFNMVKQALTVVAAHGSFKAECKGIDDLIVQAVASTKAVGHRSSIQNARIDEMQSGHMD